MKVTQEKLPDSQIVLEIELSGETSRNTYEKVVRDLARSSNIPGFRKGKVPRPILMQRIGKERIKGAVIEQLIQTGIKDAIEQESIDALGNYQLKSEFDNLVDSFEPGKPFSFSAAVDVPPSVELGDYQNLSIQAEEIVYDPQTLEDYLEESRAKNADLMPIEDRAAAMGDIAILDFAGKITVEGAEPEEIEGGSATDFEVEMAEGKLIPGMIEGVVGMSPDETKEVSVTFPEDYANEELAGKPAVFSITLKELKAKDLPDLDDDFAEDVSNGEYETIAELKESLEKQFREKVENETKNNINNALVNALLEQANVDLPDTLIQDEVTQVLTQSLMQLQQMGLDVKQLVNSDTIPKMRENSRPEAIENLKKKLILAEIAEKEALSPKEDAITTKMKEIEAELASEDIDYDKLRTMVEEDLTAENTFNWLREKAGIELVPEGSLAKEESEAEEDDSPIEEESQTEEAEAGDED
ncbi:trigger factor [Xenococcus sp. PCC 7305]|uniref:trigger factor n=1 Tax=Xenococcus sp. PCC 7305 TaxID=102125 RepID=UPI0002ACD35F|nr:trigger factor [Xenococcus sp. PCC 7305]ELS05068.1 trigger factor [Xenococcus sp. PCC 7305]